MSSLTKEQLILLNNRPKIKPSLLERLRTLHLCLPRYRKTKRGRRGGRKTKSNLIDTCANSKQLQPLIINSHENVSNHPCGICEITVTWNTLSVCCDDCPTWYHAKCVDDNNNNNNGNGIQHTHTPTITSWCCVKCNTGTNYPSTYHSFETLNTSKFTFADNTTSTLQSIDSSFSPTAFSSPRIRQTFNLNDGQDTSHETTSRTDILSKKENFRVICVNFQSIRNKTSTFAACLDYVKPDVVIGCESWLTPEHTNCEIFPEGYQTNVFRKDRNKHGGGVFIAVHDDMHANEIEIEGIDSELTWAEIKLGSKSLIVVSYYRPPTASLDSLDSLRNLITKLLEKKERHIIIGGDFNLPHICWETNSVRPGANQAAHHRAFLEILNDHGLEQIQRQPTRGENVLDLYVTNHPGLIKVFNNIPGLSDHDIIVFDSDIEPHYKNAERRKIHLFKKANKELLKEKFVQLSEEIVSQRSNDVEEKWDKLKTSLSKIVDENVPSKLSTKKPSQPWITTNLRKKMIRKHRLYSKAKRTRSERDWNNYREITRTVQKETRRQHWDYIHNTLEESMQHGNTKPFWRYIKAKRKDNIGVASLRHDGTLHQDSRAKADILNNQFESVFTRDNIDEIMPPLPEERYPDIDQIQINIQGVEKLLMNTDEHKACGPDKIPNHILKHYANEIAPAITDIFNTSLETGILPKDWKHANVTPVYKKGSKHVAANYRPVSLTSVCCKLLEHILCRHIMNHLEKYNILTPLQHGFRSGHSCESQLITTMHDLMKSFDRKTQTDMIILDFSKAFDTVPHTKLLYKLENYGIRGAIHKWISSFLTQRTQQVIIEGISSSTCHVESGVPQGTVLGPLLFLCHINDLPLAVTSQTRLFADDCLLYRTITSPAHQLQLQADLTKLEEWAQTWGMRFNATKCYKIELSRSKTPHKFNYTLDDHTLEQVENNPYLGVTISENLKWQPHINKITKKANSTLGFIKRNLRHCHSSLKETAYISLVRSVLDYASTVWDPYLQKEIDSIETIQRRAARFVCNDYGKKSSVTDMMAQLGWIPLTERRKEQRLTLLFKVLHDETAIASVTIDIEQNPRSQRKTNSRPLKLPKFHTDTFRYSFVPRTIKEWNSLPDACVNATTLDVFKLKISEHFAQTSTQNQHQFPPSDTNAQN